MDLARAAGWISAPPDAVVIGDTPHDIQCGRAVGARTVAVATGTYGVDELRRHGAWRVVAELPPPDRFIRMLEGAEVSADA
jgi:phosphoglycolate phosphatase-like HAD superfamily hydrolase